MNVQTALLDVRRMSQADRLTVAADALYHRADWQWAQDGGATVTHGWKPESGFLKYRWEGYHEALMLYILGLGSPIHPLSENSYLTWASTYRRAHWNGSRSGGFASHQVRGSPDDCQQCFDGAGAGHRSCVVGTASADSKRSQ